MWEAIGILATLFVTLYFSRKQIQFIYAREGYLLIMNGQLVAVDETFF
jgi:hypothetical protein